MKMQTAQYPDLKPGRYVNLTVSDTGHGIPKEDMDRIFDPYFTTKEVGKGTGMGLAVVHSIVKEHNGKVTVKSEPGKEKRSPSFSPRLKKMRLWNPNLLKNFPRGMKKYFLLMMNSLL